MKTGFTNGANRCLVTSCIRNGFDIITVVLGADTKRIRTTDSIKLIEYTYSNYEKINIQGIVEEKFKEWKVVNEDLIYINKGGKNNIKVKLGRNKYVKYPVNKKDVDNISIEIKGIRYLEAPVKEGTKIGTISVKVGEKEIDTIEITTAIGVEKKEPLNYLYDIISNYDILLRELIIK